MIVVNCKQQIRSKIFVGLRAGYFERSNNHGGNDVGEFVEAELSTKKNRTKKIKRQNIQMRKITDGARYQ